MFLAADAIFGGGLDGGLGGGLTSKLAVLVVLVFLGGGGPVGGLGLSVADMSILSL